MRNNPYQPTASLFYHLITRRECYRSAILTRLSFLHTYWPTIDAPEAILFICAFSCVFVRCLYFSNAKVLISWRTPLALIDSLRSTLCWSEVDRLYILHRSHNFSDTSKNPTSPCTIHIAESVQRLIIAWLSCWNRCELNSRINRIERVNMRQTVSSLCFLNVIDFVSLYFF